MKNLNISDDFPMAEWNQMQRFLHETYRPGYVMTNRRLFSWQFGVTENISTANIICAWNGRRLVGILGYMPLRMFWGHTDDPITAVWMANWMVESEHRKGIGALLMRRLMELYPILLGQGAGALNVPIAECLGFRIYPRIPRYVAVFEQDKATAFAINRRAPLPATWQRRPQMPDIFTKLPADYDPDWSLYPDMSFGTVRSADYMGWRYADHPVFDYNLRVLGNGSSPAVCVFRIERTSGLVSNSVGRIVEFFCPHADEGRRDGIALLQGVLAEMAAQGCAFADFFGTARYHSQVLEQAGMTGRGAANLATRLNPVELKPRDQNLEIWARRDHSSPPDLRELYITKSDGDQDRPN